MWFAATDDEANFIFDLMADRNATEPMLKYASWLENRGQHREAEFLRLELSPTDNEDRLKILRQELDSRWLGTVTGRCFRAGDVVRITAGVFRGMDGDLIEVDLGRARAGLILHIFYSPRELIWVPFTDLLVLKHAADEAITQLD